MFLYLVQKKLKQRNHRSNNLIFYERKNVYKSLFKTFQHRAKISISLTGFKMNGKHKYNIINAVSNRGSMTLLTRKKISIGNRGKKRSTEIRKKISQALTGRKLSFEHRLKLKNKLSGINNPRSNKTHSKNSKRKISMTMLKKKIK
jgi:hypothetical protein